MDYIKQLEEIKSKLLEAKSEDPITNANIVAAYEKVLEDFKKKECNNFQAELLGDKKTEEPIQVDSSLILGAFGLAGRTYGEIEEMMKLKKQ